LTSMCETAGQNGLKDEGRSEICHQTVRHTSGGRRIGEKDGFEVLSIRYCFETGDPIGTMGSPKDNFVLRISSFRLCGSGSRMKLLMDLF
jgi:hypothetical protein